VRYGIKNCGLKMHEAKGIEHGAWSMEEKIAGS
jgi:hypothetical protein